MSRVMSMNLGVVALILVVALIASFMGNWILNEQRAEAKTLIYQCLAGRLGWNIHDMQRADGLEIYISQGAKPGLGGQLMAKKVTPEIARIRGIPAGIDLRSPSRHPDVLLAQHFEHRGASVTHEDRRQRQAETKRRQKHGAQVPDRVLRQLDVADRRQPA